MKQTHFGAMLKRYRQHRDLGIREVAKEIGIGGATYLRLERGIGEPELCTWRKLEIWMFESAPVP